MLDSDAGFPPAPIPPEPQAAQNEQTAGKKGKATAQDWVFYLVVGIVICIILLAVVVIYMVSPGSF